MTDLITGAETWGSGAGSEYDYAASYLAVKFLNTQAANDGEFKAVMTSLTASNNMDTALGNVTGYANEADFVADITANLDAAFIGANYNIDWASATETDTGSYSGNDHTGGGALNAEDIVDEATAVDTADGQPLTNFNINWPAEGQSMNVKLHIGANKGQNVDIELDDMTSYSLGMSGLDVTDDAKVQDAIDKVDSAIEKVSATRSKMGSYINRLEHTINNLDMSAENMSAANSRIEDVDMAKEMMEFTKNNILTQAAQAMLAQANQSKQGILSLLR